MAGREKKDKRSIGSYYERMANEYLRNKGYKIVKCNYYTRFGEVDIIAMDNQTYVFVEVKYRSAADKGLPYEAVTVKKQSHLMKSAVVFCKKHRLFNHSLRFDIIDILNEEITHYTNAFEMDPRYCQF